AFAQDACPTPQGADETPLPGSAGLPRRPLLEDYVRSLPQLGPPAQLPVDLIIEEYRVRHRWGDRPGHAEYAARFASQGEPLLHALAQLDQDLAARPRRDAPRQEGTTDAPHQIGRFALLEEVGSGAFGSVWRAWDTGLGRPVAVKLPRRGSLTTAAEE